MGSSDWKEYWFIEIIFATSVKLKVQIIIKSKSVGVIRKSDVSHKNIRFEKQINVTAIQNSKDFKWRIYKIFKKSALLVVILLYF